MCPNLVSQILSFVAWKPTGKPTLGPPSFYHNKSLNSPSEPSCLPNEGKKMNYYHYLGLSNCLIPLNSIIPIVSSHQKAPGSPSNQPIVCAFRRSFQTITTSHYMSGGLFCFALFTAKNKRQILKRRLLAIHRSAISTSSLARLELCGGCDDLCELNPPPAGTPSSLGPCSSIFMDSPARMLCCDGT
jgi:hypothetical protein